MLLSGTVVGQLRWPRITIAVGDETNCSLSHLILSPLLVSEFSQTP